MGCATPEWMRSDGRRWVNKRIWMQRSSGPHREHAAVVLANFLEGPHAIAQMASEPESGASILLAIGCGLGHSSASGQIGGPAPL
jgi:hypothetical protein